MEEKEFLEKSTNIKQLVDFSFNKYKSYILYRSSIYIKISKNKYQKDDFINDVYLELFYFMSKIDKHKISNNFSFYVYVYYATCRVFKRLSVEMRNKYANLNRHIKDDYYDNFELMNKHFIVKNLKLNNRQTLIFNLISNNIKENKILKKLDISHGTYFNEMKSIKNKLIKLGF